MKLFIFLLGLTIGAYATMNEKNPCAAERDRLLGQGQNPPPGTFVPQCTDNGWYKHQQSHGSTGHTWLVIPKTGKEVPGTRVRPGQQVETRKCLADQATALPPPKLVGRNVPECNEQTGHFKALQSNPSTGYRWCVNVMTGETIEGTMTRPGNQTQLPCQGN